MLKIELWKPCLDCPCVDIDVERDNVYHCGISVASARVTCSHAAVCARIDGAEPLIGGDAE